MERLPACELWLFRPTILGAPMPWRDFLLGSTYQFVALRLYEEG